MQYQSAISSIWTCGASRSRVAECSKVLLQEIVYILHRIGRSGHSAALYLSQAAIDEQLDASYVAGVVGGQKQNGLRDFIRGAGTAQGNIAN
jgi:hypothetical protein